MNEIGESVYRAGFRKLLIVNGHGGQPQVMEMAARELRLRHGDFVVRAAASPGALPHAAGQATWPTSEKKLAMHAGHAETALMLALAPETVHMERAVANYPPVFPSKLLSPDGRPACAWTARDFGPSGVIGDPLPRHARAGPGDPRLAGRQLGRRPSPNCTRCAGSRATSPPGAARTSTGHVEHRAG